MNLNKYLKEIETKDKCPEDCELKKYSEIAVVPPPEEVLGIIISRDPTIDWLYRYLKNESDKNVRRKILFSSAIPLSLLTKLLIFMRNNHLDENDKKCLFYVIFQKTYWTHLHKCLTDTNDKVSIKFKPKNANECAEQWLTKELELAINKKTRFIIALGKDVQTWVQKWKQEKNKNIKVLNLPHPSGQNNPIWYRSTKCKQKIKETEKEIRKLIKLAKEIRNHSQVKQSPKLLQN